MMHPSEKPEALTKGIIVRVPILRKGSSLLASK